MSNMSYTFEFLEHPQAVLSMKTDTTYSMTLHEPTYYKLQ